MKASQQPINFQHNNHHEAVAYALVVQNHPLVMNSKKGSSREIKKICSDIIDLFSKIKIVGFICQEITLHILYKKHFDAARLRFLNDLDF